MRLWKTRAGVVVREVERMHVRDRSGKHAVKAFAVRWATGGEHGWLWLKNLKPVPMGES